MTLSAKVSSVTPSALTPYWGSRTLITMPAANEDAFLEEHVIDSATFSGFVFDKRFLDASFCKVGGFSFHWLHYHFPALAKSAELTVAGANNYILSSVGLVSRVRNPCFIFVERLRISSADFFQTMGFGTSFQVLVYALTSRAKARTHECTTRGGICPVKNPNQRSTRLIQARVVNGLVLAVRSV